MKKLPTNAFGSAPLFCFCRRCVSAYKIFFVFCNQPLLTKTIIHLDRFIGPPHLAKNTSPKKVSRTYLPPLQHRNHHHPRLPPSPALRTNSCHDDLSRSTNNQPSRQQIHKEAILSPSSLRSSVTKKTSTKKKDPKPQQPSSPKGPTKFRCFLHRRRWDNQTSDSKNVKLVLYVYSKPTSQQPHFSEAFSSPQSFDTKQM